MTDMRVSKKASVFLFDGHDVRVQQDDVGEVWFCANDVCAALGFGNPHQALATHVDSDDLQRMEALDGRNLQRETNFVNESGLYSLVMGSRLESARRFKRWVTSEVLPSIRRNGGYSKEAKPEDAKPKLPGTYREALLALVAEIDAREAAEAKVKTVEVRAIAAEVELEEQAPKVKTYERFLSCDGSITQTELAKSLRTTAVALGRWLRESGYMFDGSDPRPTAWAIENGLAVYVQRTFEKPDGSTGTAGQVRFTPRGAERVGEEFNQEPSARPTRRLRQPYSRDQLELLLKRESN